MSNIEYYVLNNEVKRMGDDLKFVFEDDNRNTYNVYICEDDVKHFLDLADELPLDLDLACDDSLRIGAQGVLDNFLRGGTSYEIAIQKRKVIGYRFYKEDNTYHTIDKKRVGNPNEFLSKEPKYIRFEPFLG